MNLPGWWPRWEGVIALCPTCHRRAHFANDGTRYNDALITRLKGKQP
jgi:hypothetical protein